MIKIQQLYNHTLERRFVWALCMALCTALFLYVLFVGLTTFNVAAHSALSKEIQVLNSQIGNLEAQYVALSGNISRESAYMLGFEKPEKEIFAFRKRLVLR